MRNYVQKRKNIVWVISFLCLIGIGALFLVPISYYSMKPGEILNVRTFVHLSEKKYPRGGDFFLTTVLLKKGTIFDYLVSKMTDTIELIPIDEIVVAGENVDQYKRRQQENMHSSQQSAIVAAYRYVRKPVKMNYEGVEAFRVTRKHSELKEGDLIQKIDLNTISTTEDLLAYLKAKKVGQTVNIELLRLKKKITKKLQLIRLPGKEVRAGLGILPVTRVHLTTTPSVKIDASDIGGPSAGLMFSLEIINQLLPEDLTKGYQIAGTGTISPDGVIGQIGGIEQKILAAHRQGMYLFFCPKDVDPDDKNERQARQKLEELKSTMKIVPVASLKEAIDYLKELK